jgi:hypothetical protein
VQYAPSEKYGVAERLKLALADEVCEHPRALFNAQNIPTEPTALQSVKELVFYFAIFHTVKGRKIIGVRRATQFKGVMKAKGRLLRVIDQTLAVVTDDVFKLDWEFDYLVTASSIYILHPSGFEYTAQIDDHILSHAATHATDLEKAISFIDFSGIARYVGNHKRAARLVAALRSRADLTGTCPKMLTKECGETGIKLVETNGKFAPVQGQEMPFLMLLDRRRYRVSLVPSVDETYEAASRRGV